MASYAQKGDAAAYSRDAIISNMLSEVGGALEGSLECCPALPTVLKLCHFLVRTRVPGPLPASARATSRNVCMVASATVETVRVRQGVWAASITR